MVDIKITNLELFFMKSVVRSFIFGKDFLGSKGS